MNHVKKFWFFFALCVVVIPFAVYYFQQKAEILSIYAQLDQSPNPQQRILTPKDDQKIIRILSINGGGVRGIIPSHVLKYLEESSGKPVNELFDFFMGTSTGAIASVLLTLPGENNRPRYTAEDLLNFYNRDAKKIFYNPWYHRILTLDGWIGPKYLASSRYDLLKHFLGDTYFDQLLNNVVIPTYGIYNKEPELFFNWKIQGVADTNFAVTDLLTGAISPPGMFPSVVFGSSGKKFVLADGALFANNPDLAATLIAMSTYPNKQYILVSLGTGRIISEIPSTKTVDWGLFQWAKNIVPAIVDSTMKFNNFILRKAFPFNLDVYSFNMDIDFADSALDDTSEQNLRRLNQDGKDLVLERKRELDELVAKLIHP